MFGKVSIEIEHRFSCILPLRFDRCLSPINLDKTPHYNSTREVFGKKPAAGRHDGRQKPPLLIACEPLANSALHAKTAEYQPLFWPTCYTHSRAGGALPSS